MPTKNEQRVLKAHGWEVDCGSPLELSHPDGSRATGQAAEYLILALKDEPDPTHPQPSDKAVGLVNVFSDAVAKSTRFPATANNDRVAATRGELLHYIARLENP